MTASKNPKYSWVGVVTKPSKGSSELKVLILDWKSPKSAHMCASESFKGQEETVFLPCLTSVNGR